MDESNPMVQPNGLNIKELPIEILLRVFLLFTPQQLCSLIAHVCTKWHQLSRDPSVWRKLWLYRTPPDVVQELFRSAPLSQLTTLDVWVWSGTGDELITLVSEHCPALVKFDLTGSNVSVSSDQLEALAANCPNIRALLFNQAMLSDRKYDVFARFAKLNVLRFNFALSGKDANDDDEVSLVNCKQLKDLDVTIVDSMSHLSDAQYNDRFCKFVRSQQPVLTSLYTTGQRPFNDSFIEISKCIRLQDLTLNADFLTDDSLLAITRNLRLLRYLSLWPHSGSLLTSQGLIVALTSDGSLTNFNDLCLSEIAAVNDDVVAAIADRFAGQLHDLSLQFCVNVTDVGLSRVLAKCSALEILKLSGLTRLTDASFRPIPTALPKLYALLVSGCTVDSRVIDELKMARPDLRIY